MRNWGIVFIVFFIQPCFLWVQDLPMVIFLLNPFPVGTRSSNSVEYQI